MRLIVLFDLPVKTKPNKRAYQQFHKFLISDGYAMMQLSVYSRVTNGLDGVQKHLARLKANLPPRGSVRAMTVTEKQYESMLFLVGKPTIQEKTVASQMQIWL
ncbi:MAG: CRISPR-associated endonuclease Cas2 [Actinobacteria bacterium]|nr:MAG: CRISPR-associated endonuclease Cas2 [Actinomycetota bacterium]